MARISTIGFDAIALRMDNRTKEGKKRTRDMLKAGGEVFVRTAKSEALMYGIYDGQSDVHIVDHIVATNLRVRNDVASIDVTIEGSRTRGKKRPITTRNGAIGFINNYGRGGHASMNARPFFSNAKRDAEPEIRDLWREMMNNDS